MTKKEFVKIGYQTREPRWDFGIINDAKGYLRIEKEAWLEYVKKRQEFETLHLALIRSIPKRHKPKTFTSINQVCDEFGWEQPKTKEPENTWVIPQKINKTKRVKIEEITLNIGCEFGKKYKTPEPKKQPVLQTKDETTFTMSSCPKCEGKGYYRYDEHHFQPCELCCRHDAGFWLLTEHYGKENGMLCCKRGCGFTKPNNNAK